MQCPSCGTENPEGSRFCMSCASPLAPPAPAAPASPPPPPPPPPWYVVRPRHREPHEDLVGLATLAFLLLAISAVFAWNANLPAELQEWIRVVTTRNTIFVRPPEGVVVSAAWFFVAMGIFELFAAALRASLRWTRLRIVGRILAGGGDLVFAALLFLYSARTISGPFVIAILAGTAGVFLLIYVSLGIYWSWGYGTPRPEPVRPPTQP